MEGLDSFAVNFKKFVVKEPRREHAQEMAYGMLDALYNIKARDKTSYGYLDIVENLLEGARKDVRKGDMDGAWSAIRYIDRILDSYKSSAFNPQASGAGRSRAVPGTRAGYA